MKCWKMELALERSIPALPKEILVWIRDELCTMSMDESIIQR